MEIALVEEQNMEIIEKEQNQITKQDILVTNGTFEQNVTGTLVNLTDGFVKMVDNFNEVRKDVDILKEDKKQRDDLLSKAELALVEDALKNRAKEIVKEKNIPNGLEFDYAYKATISGLRTQLRDRFLVTKTADLPKSQYENIMKSIIPVLDVKRAIIIKKGEKYQATRRRKAKEMVEDVMTNENVAEYLDKRNLIIVSKDFIKTEN